MGVDVEAIASQDAALTQAIVEATAIFGGAYCAYCGKVPCKSCTFNFSSLSSHS